MPHDTPLVATLVAGIGLAFVFGALAHRLRISPLVGYLVAGIVVGPLHARLRGRPAHGQRAGRDRHHPADVRRRSALFARGPARGALDRGARCLRAHGLVTLLGMGLGRVVSWPIGEASCSVSRCLSRGPVVALRALQERHLLESERGRIAIAWLVVEDSPWCWRSCSPPAIARILNESFEEGASAAPVTMGPMLATIGITLLKVAAFVALMLVVGRRAIPWLLPRDRTYGLAGTVPSCRAGHRPFSSLTEPRCCSAYRSRWARSSPEWCCPNPS